MAQNLSSGFWSHILANNSCFLFGRIFRLNPNHLQCTCENLAAYLLVVNYLLIIYYLFNFKLFSNCKIWERKKPNVLLLLN